jgi:hypothetical protein
VIFSSYGNLAKLLNYRQLCIDFILIVGAYRHIQQYFSYIMVNSFSGGGPIEIHDSECSKTRKIRFHASVNTG